MRVHVEVLGFAGLSLLVCSSSLAAPAAVLGVVVDEVKKGGRVEKAGVQVGDVLLSWERKMPSPLGRGGGTINSPFDLANVEVLEVSRSPVTLRGRRGGEDVSFELRLGDWALVTRPQLTDDRLVAYTAASKAAADGQLEPWKTLAQEWSASAPTLDSCWLWLRLGQLASRGKKWPDAHAAFDAAAALARKLKAPVIEALVLEADGDAFKVQNDFPHAKERHHAAIKLRQAAPGNALWVSLSYVRLGAIAGMEADGVAGEAAWTQALAIRQKLAPRSIETVRALNGLGAAAAYRADLALAEERYAKALAVNAEVDPEGDIACQIRGNMGTVVSRRGDFAGAEQRYRESLAIAERLGDDNAYFIANNNVFLGNLALFRGDSESAEPYYRRALSLFEKLSPDSPWVGGTLNNLSIVQRERGDLAGAHASAERALALRSKASPQSVEVAETLNELTQIELRSGNLDAATRYLDRSKAIRHALVPESTDEAYDNQIGGDILVKKKDLKGALEQYRAALAIRARLAPGSMYEAESLHAVGKVERQLGHAAEASTAMLAATLALEAARTKMGGSEDSGLGFEAQYGAIYRDAIEALVDDGKEAEAFEMLERSRARAFLATLEERDLLFATDLPPKLRAELRDADAEFDGLQTDVSHLSAGKNAAEVEAQLSKLAAARGKRAQALTRLRQASPRLAALKYPQPLSLDAVRKSLDPGTTLLAYSVGKTRTVLFVVRAMGEGDKSLQVVNVAVGEDALRDRVAAFRGFIERGREGELEPGLVAQGAKLYDDLVRPAEAAFTSAQRLLLSPDGPLHSLPFAALVTSAAPVKYLVESKPLHTSLSATVYAQLKTSRRASWPAGKVVLAAFGDPVYSAASESAVATSRAVPSRAARLAALPFTGDEVRRIGAVFSPGATMYLGDKATEEHARALKPGVRYIHFATHALVDRRFPLDSALALAVPPKGAAGRENGLLQAWEIFESVRLDADLVTLSACETSLGRDMGGEGLIGLSRAFQYAGARTVLASLWSISDRSTPELMEAFYRALREGKSKDEALRTAQLSILQRPKAHPFHWAAFQLSGDFK